MCCSLHRPRPFKLWGKKSKPKKKAYHIVIENPLFMQQTYFYLFMQCVPMWNIVFLLWCSLWFINNLIDIAWIDRSIKHHQTLVHIHFLIIMVHAMYVCIYHWKHRNFFPHFLFLEREMFGANIEQQVMHDLKTKQICFECIPTYNVSNDAKLLRKSATFTPASGWKTLHLGNLNDVRYIRCPVSKTF